MTTCPAPDTAPANDAYYLTLTLVFCQNVVD